MRKKGKTKTKKSQPLPLIRTDVWRLVTKPKEKKMMLMTVASNRKYLLPLVLIINAQWSNLGVKTSPGQVAVEKMIHLTASNLNHKHSYYQKIVSKYPCYRKFPSYLRRAAIADAIGIVSSFQSRYRSWQSGNRFRHTNKPHRLTVMCKKYPALYKSKQVLYGKDYQTVALKVWSKKDWIWLNNIVVKNKGKNRHLGSGNKLNSPSLVVNKNKCKLSMPVQIKPVKKEETDYVCSVDLGINNAATAAIVGRDGTARTFINPARGIDYRNKLDIMIAKKAKQTSNLTGQKLLKGLCGGIKRKSANQNLEISRKVGRQIVQFAKKHKVKVIVLENLWGWKAKAGKKRSLMKQKFHLWCHRKIVELITDKWTELGGDVQIINSKYTSAVAFDGSGKVRRSPTNYSLALFKSGKQDHADLNASYNIGARYWDCLIVEDKNFSRVYDSKSSDGILRTPIVLGTLRNLAVS
ncbi:MAG: IS200/IS605 family element transposase accessory protein TnpB [Moorea sp. SIO2B7]|nr:IS200/IS605 family element transposase accessory protein TnpB [Moorena sp. SIO2B7]